LGWTYRLSELDASTAEAGLDRLDEETAARMANGNHLRCQLRDLAGIELPEAVPGATNVYSSFPVLVQPDELGLPEAAAAALRDTLQACMLAEGLPLDRWQPEPIGGPVVPGRPPAQRQLPPPVGIADHPVADAVRASTLLLGRDRSLLGTPSTARTMEKIAECFNKVLVENRDRLRQLACERMSTPAAV
jgi:dTDP-4-amino-4,6-dideoxygalactose transaminase